MSESAECGRKGCLCAVCHSHDALVKQKATRFEFRPKCKCKNRLSRHGLLCWLWDRGRSRGVQTLDLDGESRAEYLICLILFGLELDLDSEPHPGIRGTDWQLDPHVVRVVGLNGTLESIHRVADFSRTDGKRDGDSSNHSEDLQIGFVHVLRFCGYCCCSWVCLSGQREEEEKTLFHKLIFDLRTKARLAALVVAYLL